MIEDFATEFRRYRTLIEKAVAQVPDEALNHVPSPDGNSIAMVVRHISGNLTSRFTDFLSSDGEKAGRDRDSEFVERPYSREEVLTMLTEGHAVLDRALAGLSDADLSREVSIRHEAMPVSRALCRALAHISYHTGQVVLLARVLATAEWQTLSIPRKPRKS